MTDFCCRCRETVVVVPESRPGYTRWYCCRCGMTTDQYYDEDSEYEVMDSRFLLKQPQEQGDDNS